MENPDPEYLEKEANLYIEKGDFEKAYALFKKAAEIYEFQGRYKESALCFASAACCYNVNIGEKTWCNSAEAYKNAGESSRKAKEFEYASLLYKYAASCYERDGDFVNFSDCFYISKDCYRKHLFNSLTLRPKKNFIKFFILWLGYTISFLVWGYGERPFRTFFFIIFFIFLFSFLYCFGYINYNGNFITPHFLNSLYLSIITFTTVGYGDIVPIGINKFFASLEAFLGVSIMPIFIVGLSRRYLRI